MKLLVVLLIVAITMKLSGTRYLLVQVGGERNGKSHLKVSN